MIYKKYLFKKFASMFLLILLTIFFFNSVMECCIRYKDIFRTDIPTIHSFIYISLRFISGLLNYAYLALLLAVLQVYLSSAIRNEFITLLSSGLSKKQVIQPLITFGLFITLFLYLSAQWIFPPAINWTKHFESIYFHNTPKFEISAIRIPADNSNLVYRLYDPYKHELADVYWLNNSEELWHLQKLNLQSQYGSYVDHLKKSSSGWQLIKSQEIDRHLPFAVQEEHIRLQSMAPRQQTAYFLAQHTQLSLKKLPSRTAEFTTAFYRYLTLPLLNLFIIILPASFCLCSPRTVRPWPIVSYSVFITLVIFMLLSACYTAGAIQVFPPLLIVGIPFLLLSLWTIKSYIQLK